MVRIWLFLGLSLFSVPVIPALQAAPRMFLQTPNPETISHKVTSGETLYALAKKYGVTVAELNKLNPEAAKGLRLGQILRIPVKKAADSTASAKAGEAAVKPVASKKGTETTAASAAEKPASPDPKTKAATAKETGPATAGGKIHKVASGESLYSIAIKNGVTMAEIRKWNNLKSDKLSIGKVLVLNPAETTAVAAPGKPVSTAKPEPAKPAASKPAATKPEPAAARPESTAVARNEKPKTEPRPVKTAAENDSAGKAGEEENKTVEFAGKVTETGMAEVISQVGENAKFLALHRTAPVGTILQVKNIMNGQNVYVRVIGKLPDTGNNDKLIVRISRQAFQRLSAIDNRFRVEVSYMP